MEPGDQVSIAMVLVMTAEDDVDELKRSVWSVLDDVAKKIKINGCGMNAITIMGN